jgi:hypothetical protein
MGRTDVSSSHWYRYHGFGTNDPARSVVDILLNIKQLKIFIVLKGNVVEQKQSRT